MSKTPRPQDTGCTTIVVEVVNDKAALGVTNGLLSKAARYRKVEYDEDRDVYVVGQPK